MNLSELKVLVVEDNLTKYGDIKSALEKCKIQNIESAFNMEEAFGIIYQYNEKNSPFDLIITDMQYPLSEYGSIVDDAGERLIERLKKESIDIPVIVCSSLRYSISGILGCVWYNELSDLNKEFRMLLEKLKNLPL